MSISDVEIRLGYIFLLGREPETPSIYSLYRHLSLPEFRQVLEESQEGQKRFRALTAARADAPAPEARERAACLIHVEKTGGTTLHRLLEALYAPDRVTPVQTTDLAALSMADLRRFDLISGHFDYETTRFIPAAHVQRLSIFRDPVRRLISFYRFHRAHPPVSFADNPFVELARHLPRAAFFADPVVLGSSRTNNAYLRTFGTSNATPIDPGETEAAVRPALEAAVDRIVGLDALGITERMAESVSAIFRALGHPPPPQVGWEHRTDELFRENRAFTRVEPIPTTPDLVTALQPLIRHDVKLYRVAQEEFQRRLRT